MVGQTQDIANQTWIHKLCSRSMCIGSSKEWKHRHGVLGVHVNDVIGGGDETFDRIMTAVRKEFDFGRWDVGNFRFKGRQISQMPYGEIVFDMEQNKHELERGSVGSLDIKRSIATSKVHPVQCDGSCWLSRRLWCRFGARDDIVRT